MNPRERVLTAMDLRIPDRVPFACGLSTGHILLNTDVSPVEYSFSNEGYIDGLTQIQEKYQFDMISVGVGRDPLWRNEIDRIENKDNGQIIHFKNAYTVFCPDNDSPQNLYPPKPDLSFDSNGRFDIKQLIWLGLGLDEPIPSYMTEPVSKIMKRYGNEYLVCGSTGAGFDVFILHFGIQRAYMYLIDYPEQCKEIINLYNQQSVKWAKALIDEGATVIGIASIQGGELMLSKDMYLEFVFPFQKKLISAIHKMGAKTYTHMCGKCSDRLELIADTGTDGIECLDPPPLGNVELTDAKKRVGDRVFIKGNIDSVKLLNMTCSEAAEEGRRKIKEGAANGGYILSTACSIAPLVPAANIIALRESVEKNGWYFCEGQNECLPKKE